jgi:hypothetical protein
MPRILAALTATAIAFSGMFGGAVAADPAKVLRVALRGDITGLDPAATQDIFERRPARSL